MPHAVFVPFTAQTRMSGVDINGTSYRKGAAGSIRDWVGKLPKEVEAQVDAISKHGGTPLVVATKETALGVIYLKDIVKGGLAERFERFRAMGIRTVMITGRQSADGRCDREGSGRGRFPRAGQAGGQAGLIRKEQAAGAWWR
jgi:K+-transporting ATPase ATPase B chain